MSVDLAKIKKLVVSTFLVIQLSLAFGLNAWSEARVVNINSASAEEIAAVLKGIGEKKALRIVEFRDVMGPITSTDQLMEVKGIGEKIVARNEGLIEF